MDGEEGSTMAEFRKKPVVITARRVISEQIIKTLEGEMLAKRGDWIITGINGEEYPCDDDVFRKTYEAVDNFGERLLSIPKKDYL